MITFIGCPVRLVGRVSLGLIIMWMFEFRLLLCRVLLTILLWCVWFLLVILKVIEVMSYLYDVDNKY